MGLTGTTPALDKGTYSAETRTFVVKTHRKSDIGLQWVQFSGAGTATITIKGTLRDSAELFAAKDISNPRWSAVPGAVFASLPAGAPGSDLLFAADNAIVALIVEIVFTGSMVFEFNVNAQSRGT